MDSNKTLKKWKNNIDKLMIEHPLQIISWEATRKCNLNCKHCGSPSEKVKLNEELKTKEVIDSFNQIATDFDMSQFRHINITGGEPFVRADLLEILKKISEKLFYRNIDIQTNGWYIGKNPEIIPKLKKFGVTGIGISIDGFKDQHDNLRGVNGSYELAFKAAKACVKSGLTVTISIVANSKNADDIPEFYRLVKKEINPRIFRIMTIDPLGRAEDNKDYLLSPTQVEQIMKFLAEEYVSNCHKYHDINETMVELGCGGWLGCKLEGLVRPFIFHCVAGINNIGILYDGKLSSCSNISRDLIQGDIRKEKIKEVWDKRYEKFRNREWLKKGDCKECGEWEYCHGGPMHKRQKDGSMTDCLFQTIENKKDYGRK